MKQELNQPFPVLDLLGVEVTQVACGNHHCLALASPGVVWAWGRNKEGEVGCGDFRDKVAPTKVCHARRRSKGEQLGSAPGKQIIFVSAGGTNSVAAAIDSTVWQWGTINKRYPGEKDRFAAKNRPCAVPRAEALISQRGGGKEVEVSMSSCGCQVLDDPAKEERIQDLVVSIREMKARVAEERAELTQDKTLGAGESSGHGSLKDLQEDIAKVESDDLVLQQEIDALEKQEKSLEEQQASTRRQRNSLSQQGHMLEYTKDELELKLVDAKKGTVERKRLEDRLAEVMGFVLANASIKANLATTMESLSEEQHRIYELLRAKKRAREDKTRRLETLRLLESTASQSNGALDRHLGFLKDTSDRMQRHFAGREAEKELIPAMKQLEQDENFLLSVEQSIRDMDRRASADKQAPERSQCIRDLLQDFVNLRRSWNSMTRSRWQVEDADVSSFFGSSEPKP